MPVYEFECPEGTVTERLVKWEPKPFNVPIAISAPKRSCRVAHLNSKAADGIPTGTGPPNPKNPDGLLA